ncbi:ATP-binding protein [Streptomyces armeniacus]|uniref:ATP-binding protein n=1 Tax=Streptomyces armeniacus TaxID=83291 RepID=A0A345XSP6_9ACTN|nr:ATP-binding protein [Streptomyces armeniacus]AXK34662.1 ATP-binding protein [Streptomyces armeniacus]
MKGTPVNQQLLAALGLPEPGLYVLIGPAGSGKTNIAAAFPRTWRLSLDDFREQVADDAGAQASTRDAVAVFDAALSGRLARRLPTLVDSTNTELAVRARLLERAHRHGMLAVAIAVRTPLETCQERQNARPANRQVPTETIAWQRAGVPFAEQLLSEGFDEVRDAADLDLLHLLLARSVAAGFDPLAEVRAAFGPDLARAFAFDSDSSGSTGAFTVAGRQLAVRWSEDGDVFDHHWQARLDSEPCEDCGSPVWVKVNGARDLLDVYRGQAPDEPFCQSCDTPDWQSA